MDSLSGPPHFCVVSPEHVELHSVSAVARTPPFDMPFPQKHCVLYSVPDTVYPALLHVRAQDWGVSDCESGALKERIRFWLLSTQHPWADQPVGNPVGAGAVAVGVRTVEVGSGPLGTTPSTEYREIRLLPPQISVWFPLHSILQPLEAGAPPFWMLLSQSVGRSAQNHTASVAPEKKSTYSIPKSTRYQPVSNRRSCKQMCTRQSSSVLQGRIQCRVSKPCHLFPR